MNRFTRLERIEYEDKWVTDNAFLDENGFIRGSAIDSLAKFEGNDCGCEECSGVASMELPLSRGLQKINFCPMCGKKLN